MLSKPLSSIVEQPIVGKDVLISGVTLDSRAVESGNLFCAMKGECFDGHQFIDLAVEAGASAVAVEAVEYIKSSRVSYVVSSNLKAEVGKIAARFYNEPTQSMSVTGVTGTNGKSSITSYIAQFYHLLNVDCGQIGTLGINFSNQIIKTKNTTPDAITLQKYFYEMLQNGVTRAVMEVSSHAMVQNRCNGIHFSAAVYSNISHDHLDYHGSFDAYLDAKVKLFSWPELPLAVVNLDDDCSSRVIAAISSETKLLTYSLKSESADIYLSDVSNQNGKYDASLHYCGETIKIETQLVGEFNLYNLLAALIVVCEQGFSVREVASLCGKILPVSGRMESVANKHGIMAIVDYAHTPDALENVLVNLRSSVSGKLLTVFGCGGDRDKGKRPIMASIAERYSDYVIITADNPRTESLHKIIEQIESGMSAGSHQYCVCFDREQAIQRAVDMAGAEDCILVAGKGHEKTQTVGSKVLPFDDVKVLTLALDRKRS